MSDPGVHEYADTEADSDADMRARLVAGGVWMTPIDGGSVQSGSIQSDDAWLQDQSRDYWRKRAQQAEREVDRLSKAWADASDLIRSARMLWAAMEKLK